MTLSRTGLVVGVAAVVVLVGSSRWDLRAQVGGPAQEKPAPRLDSAKEKADREVVADREEPASIQDAMLARFDWAFREEITLQGVVDHLHEHLGAPVVLDRAALARRRLTPDSTVRLELEGVRLKTGLKLLLDQVGLTTRVVPEDNLLILTDVEGAEESSERILGELKSLHRDLHDLQDALEDLREDLGYDAERGPAVRKPTIIEEAPERQGDAIPEQKPAGSRPGM